MKKLLRLLPILLVAALLAPVESADAQDLHESRRLSPIGLARTMVGDAYVKVHYGQPYIRNRTVFGAGDEALVSYGEVWRTGANEGTEITTTEDIMVGGEMLPAGTYTIFTMPGESEWTVHFSPQVNLWATGRYDPDQDVLRVTAPVTTLDEEVDPFTIAFEPQDDGAVHMVMSWEETSVRVPLEDAE